MFPDIEGEDRFETFGNRIASIRLLCNFQSSIKPSRKPDPARTKETDAFSFKLCLESFNTSPLFLDLSFQTPGRRFPVKPGMTLCRAELREVQIVVQDLPGIVEDRAFGLANDFFKGHILERGAGNQFVEVVDVGLEVFAVVEGKGLGTDDGFEGVGCVRKVDEFMHCSWFFRVLCRVPGSGSSG